LVKKGGEREKERERGGGSQKKESEKWSEYSPGLSHTPRVSKTPQRVILTHQFILAYHRVGHTPFQPTHSSPFQLTPTYSNPTPSPSRPLPLSPFYLLKKTKRENSYLPRGGIPQPSRHHKIVLCQ